jgi:hypothetical protein
MGVCNGGLNTIRAYYKRWGKQSMTLMEIMETARDDIDIGNSHQNDTMDRNMLYPLRTWCTFRRRLRDALERAVYFKYEPRLWKKDGRAEFFLDEDDAECNISEYIGDLRLDSDYVGDPYSNTDCEVDANEILYQLLHDAARGLLFVEILRMSIEDEDDGYIEVVRK